MKTSITQKHNFGCGAACVAFVLNISYERSVNMLGNNKSDTAGFLVKELSRALTDQGRPSTGRYLKPRLRRKIYKDGVIVFIRRSARHPHGHYLVRHRGRWMDPWINLTQDPSVHNAKSGFRKRLPGSPIYAIFPIAREHR